MDPQRILIIRPSALGDVCRSVPMLVSLRRAYPGSRIDWLVQDSFVDAIRCHPALTGVVPFARRELGASLRGGRASSLWGFLRILRGARYDLAIDAQGLFRSGFFARATGAARRVGYADAREGGWFFLNERVPAPRTMHTVDRTLELVRAIGVEPAADLRLYPPAEDRAAVQADPILGAGGYVVIAPTSRWPAKLWPPERFGEVARALLDRGAERVVLVGSKGERGQLGPLLELAARDPRVVDLVGATSIGRLMGVIERARLVIALDSAALHMAVGFDRPIVALFGPTRVDLVGPYRHHGDVIQHARADDPMDHKDPSSRSMMDRIGTEEVVSAATARLESVTRSSSGSPS